MRGLSDKNGQNVNWSKNDNIVGGVKKIPKYKNDIFRVDLHCKPTDSGLWIKGATLFLVKSLPNHRYAISVSLLRCVGRDTFRHSGVPMILIPAFQSGLDFFLHPLQVVPSIDVYPLQDRHQRGYISNNLPQTPPGLAKLRNPPI
ncbi:unnamed protein product [Lepeophtheirus salmonis]|uniref:(salmon louse) hypothetical protein n=1 Tax=Lepeophtheirus salmonis TaxID=72036 RepID=A0A7R8CVQ4_LEPSM|nr:unnamed protein product [Lepeophtheirus salmonis]CAF2946843.1 unnamed protein product [Lepeophtheirus salmonis]